VGAIWDRQTFHQNRRQEVPEMGRIVVSIDPAISSEEKSNEHGIIVVGIGSDGRGYVLDDVSLKGTPSQWANRAVSIFHKWDADSVVIEVNQGGDMCRNTLTSVQPGLPIVEVRATRGKHVRAEPISSLYSLGRISHVGTFPELEDQCCQMVAGGFAGEGSPDRVDALVWGFTHLFPQLVQRPNIARKRLTPRAATGWMG
jgi:phage terminase large subunit-like protein